MKKSQQKPSKLVECTKSIAQSERSKWPGNHQASAVIAAAQDNTALTLPDPIAGTTLPRGAWYSLFNQLAMDDLARFSRTCTSTNILFKEYLNDEMGARHRLLFLEIIPIHLLFSGERRAMQLNYQLLLKLHRISPAIFNELYKMPANAAWPLAAICGDINWLVQNLGEELLREFATNEMTVLHYLVFGGQHLCIEYLLNNHLVSHTQLQADQMRMIYYAALGGNEATLSYLSQQLRFDLTQMLHINLDRFNILQPLAAGGHIKLLQGYLEHQKLKIAEGATRVNSLFMTAASEGHFEVCDLLKNSYQENPTQKNRCNQTQAHFAAQYGDLKRLQALFLQNTMLQTQEDSHGLTPFDYCIVGGHLKLLEKLIFAKDITHRQICDYLLDSYLHLACQYRQTHLLEPLVRKYRIPVGKLNKYNRSAFFYCAMSGSLACFNKLRELDNTVSPLTLDRFEISLYFQAIQSGQMFFLEQLIAIFGPLSPDSTDQVKNTLAHFAFKSFSRYVVNHIYNNFNDNVCITNALDEYPINSAAKTITHENYSYAWPFIKEVTAFYQPNILDYQPQVGKPLRQLAREQKVELFDEKNTM